MANQTFTAEDVERARITGALDLFTVAAEWLEFTDILEEDETALTKMAERVGVPRAALILELNSARGGALSALFPRDLVEIDAHPIVKELLLARDEGRDDDQEEE